jgi:hypothetical protein
MNSLIPWLGSIAIWLTVMIIILVISPISMQHIWVPVMLSGAITWGLVSIFCAAKDWLHFD